jgi:hypothetical protein
MTISDQSPILRPNSRLVAVIATGVVAIRKRLGAIGSGCMFIFVPLRSRADAEWERRLFLVRNVTGIKSERPVAILQLQFLAYCGRGSISSAPARASSDDGAIIEPIVPRRGLREGHAGRDDEDAPRGLLDVDPDNLVAVPTT